MDEDSRASLDAFCRAEHSRLVGTLTLYTGDRAVAHELAQEALARACAQWSAVRRMDAPGAWVHRVAINLATSAFRRRRAERAAVTRLGGRREALDVPETSDVLAVRRAVADLPPRMRTALVLRYYSDLSVDQAAEAMGCRPGTVTSLTSKALTALRAAGLTDLQETSRA